LIAAREELRFRATHDVLTGVAKRGIVLEALSREYSGKNASAGPSESSSWISTISNA
jgi:hypothetical protein